MIKKDILALIKRARKDHPELAQATEAEVRRFLAKRKLTNAQKARDAEDDEE